MTALNVEAMKRRLAVMMVANVVAAIAAIAAAVGYFMYALDWALFVFVGALLAGFAAQIWLIAGLRPGKGA